MCPSGVYACFLQDNVSGWSREWPRETDNCAQTNTASYHGMYHWDSSTLLFIPTIFTIPLSFFDMTHSSEYPVPVNACTICTICACIYGYALVNPVWRVCAQEHPSSWPFQEPVSEVHAPEYYKVIKIPMGRCTLWLRVQLSKIASLKRRGFGSDLQATYGLCRH